MKFASSRLVSIDYFFGAGAAACATTPDLPIATINAREILNESKIAKGALAKFRADFLSEDTELEVLASNLREMDANLEKMGSSLSRSQLIEKQNELAVSEREFERKQQLYIEDREARKRDDIQHILGVATKAVKQIDETTHIDMVLQDVVYANFRTDTTTKAIVVMDSLIDRFSFGALHASTLG